MKPAAIAAVLIGWVPATPAVEAVIDPDLPPEERGRAIAEEVERRDEGFGDSVTELVMTLSNAEGRERTRRLTWRTSGARKLTRNAAWKRWRRSNA